MAVHDIRTFRPFVQARAQGRCEYCHIPEEADFIRFEVDHVIAEQHGGQTVLENLAYACFDCNRRKGPNLSSIDPQTWERTRLLHPRTQIWEEHFRLHVDGTIIGLTAEGRTTLRLLALNAPGRVRDRVDLLAIGMLRV